MDKASKNIKIDRMNVILTLMIVVLHSRPGQETVSGGGAETI